ncbi:MAG TPA: tetratricopeptide repeat protein, partial [Polyangia bacterium]|nr:tetratricopeptide repeat protein [Polyangia bacterium]
MSRRSRSFAADGATRWRRRVSFALVVVVAAALVAVTLRGGWRALHRRAGRRTVAILDLANRAPRADDAWLATALADIVTVTLGHSDRLRVLDGDRVAEAVRRLDPRALAQPDAETLAKLRRLLDADLVIGGGYTVADDGALALELHASDEARAVVVRESGAPSGVFGVFGVALAGAQQLRRQLGDADLDDQDARAVLAMMPANVDAARAYAEGVSRWRAGRVAEAREHFERAIASDPQYAAAQLALARAQAWLGYARRAREAATRALALSDGLPRVARLATAAYAAELDGEVARAVDLLRVELLRSRALLGLGDYAR